MQVLQAVVVCVCQSFKCHTKALQYVKGKHFHSGLCGLPAESCSSDALPALVPADVPRASVSTSSCLSFRLQLVKHINASSPQGRSETGTQVLLLFCFDQLVFC